MNVIDIRLLFPALIVAIAALSACGSGDGSTASGTTPAPDKAPPVITINGTNPDAVAVGAVYTDAGATAVDEIDGTVTVTINGTVDTGTEGSYIITYTATDNAGNTATATRTVYVDGTAPVITVNGESMLSVPVGSIYADAGATAVDAIDGNVAVTASGAVDTAAEDRYIITYSAMDGVGNTATASRTVDVKQALFSFSTQEAREPLLNVNTGNIGGGIAWEVALSHDGRTAYVTTQGTSQDILRIVDVSDPGSPSWLASYDISSTATTVTLSSDDRTAFIADGDGGLHIVDVSNPASPNLLATYNTIGAAYQVTLSSDATRAYVAEGGDGMEIIDVSNLASPSQLGVSAWDARKIVLSSDDGKAYTVNTSGLVIHDVSDPTAPSFLGRKSLLGTGSGTDLAVSSDGKTAYLSAANDGLRILDVSNPASPQWLASFDTGEYATHVALSPDDSKLYMSTTSHGLYLFNVSNPAAPSLWHKYYTGTSTNPGSSYSVAFSNDGTKAYFANGAKGVQILTSPALPALLGNYKDAVGNSANDVCLSGDGSKAYVADTSYGLRIVEVSDPASPRLLGTYFNVFSNGGAYSVALAGDGNTAYVADGTTGLKIVNVSNPALPSLSGSYGTVDARDVALSSDGSTAYVADNYAGLQIIDVSDPEAPVWLGRYNTSGSAFGVALSSDGNTAYVADYSGGLQLIDVSDPGAPALLGHYDTGSAMAVALSKDGSRAYIADNTAGLKIIDVSNPASPTLLGSYDTIGFAVDVAVSADGRRAYVADDVSGLHIIDVSDPASPFWLGSDDTMGYASGVMLTNDSSTAYVADSHGGLKILDVSQDNLYKGRNFGTSHVALRIQSNVQVPLTLQVTADRSDIITVSHPLTVEYADYNEQDVLIPIASIPNAGGWTELTIVLSYGAQSTSRMVYVWVVKN